MTQGTHFYFMAIAGPNGFLSEAFGHVTPYPGATRLDVFKDLRKQMLDNCPPNSAVTGFSLELNDIGA
jgi:hypothetical protein